MLKVYVTSNNSLTKRTKDYLTKNKVAFVTIHVCEETFTREEFNKILHLTDDVYTIISERSKIYKDYRDSGLDFDDLTLGEVYDMIAKNPTMLKCPIVFNEKENRLVVGKNMELLRRIVPTKR